MGSIGMFLFSGSLIGSNRIEAQLLDATPFTLNSWACRYSRLPLSFVYTLSVYS